MKTLLLVNDKSGAVNTLGVDNCISAIRETENLADLAIHRASGDPSSLIEKTNKAINAGNIGKILLLGGDGTAAALAGALADTNIALAPLPGGTMNAYSRDLGYDSDLFTAIKQLSSTQITRVDVGFAGPYPFLNNLVFGAYSVVAQSREHLREADTLVEKVEALTEIVGSIAHTETEIYKINIDGDSKVIHTNTMMVANNFYDDVGVMLPKRTRLDAGFLGLYTANAKTPADFLTILFESLTRTLDESDMLKLSSCRQCQVSSASNILEVTIDGEAMELSSPLNIKIKANSLRVLKPA